MQSFSFNPSIYLSGEEWMIAITSFETTNSVFIITNEDNSSSISTPSHWKSEDGEERTDKLNKLLELRSETDFEIYVKLKKRHSNRNRK